MKAFVTGGSGFIGRPLLQKLVDRGYDVYALTRFDANLNLLASTGAAPVRGDILDVESMRPAMSGSDVVFHCAGWYEIGSDNWMSAESINVNGTRQVLGLATELGVPRIIYTSTGAIYGDTGGMLVDETYYHEGPFTNEYERTKWLAHYKVAVPLIKQGSPISIAAPTITYGPGDHSMIGALMRTFYQGKLFFIPGPKFTVSYVHVDDVADGLIKILEQGTVGETYNLAGPAIPLGEMVDFWAQITGKPAPRISVPARFFKPFGPVLEALREVIRLPDLYSQEAVDTLNITYMHRGEKAREQLGWRARTLHEGMVETFQWIDETTPPKDELIDQRRRKIAGVAFLAAALVFILWLISRRKK